MKFIGWSDDHWKSKQGSYMEYDKLEHFLLGFIGFMLTSLLLPLMWNIIIWELIAIGWEVKDGLLTYDGKNIQGFSWKDLLADNYGFALAIIIYVRFG